MIKIKTEIKTLFFDKISITIFIKYFNNSNIFLIKI